jgi:hypothetical protein
MGNSRYDANDYQSYARSTAHHTVHTYAKNKIDDEFDPLKIKFRESVKSKANPKPTPIIVAIDQTGSMGILAEAIRKGLGTLFEQIIDRDPVSDPHVMAMTIGDMDNHERAPLQVTQFEADPVTIGKQIERLYLEGNGGGNAHETYLGPLYFAAMRIKADAFAEGRKGFIFTVGDEPHDTVLTRENINKYIGDNVESDLSDKQILAMVERNWNVFHIMVEEGSYMSGDRAGVMRSWQNFIGQHAMPLADHTKLAEVVISTIEVVAGRDKDAIIKSWSGATNLVVAKAISGLPSAQSATSGPVRL